MDLSTVADFFRHFETERVISLLQDLHVGRLIHSPWFLGGMGVAALIALVMHWRLLLVTILSITGFSWLLSYTLAKGTNIDSPTSDTLLVFVGGGAVLIMVVIYLLFIKSE